MAIGRIAYRHVEARRRRDRVGLANIAKTDVNLAFKLIEPDVSRGALRHGRLDLDGGDRNVAE